MAEEWMDMILAPGLTVDGWYRLQNDLDPRYATATWRRVIRAMERRFEDRFIKPADALIAREKRRKRIPAGPGFAVLAIDCLLIEAITGYERGSHTRRGETGDA